MKRCKIGITEEMLRKKLDIPTKYKISDIEFDGKRCLINIYLYGGKGTPEASIPETIHIKDLEEKKVPDEVRKEAEEIGRKLKQASEDPEVLKRGEELQKKLSRLTPEDLLRTFDK